MELLPQRKPRLIIIIYVIILFIAVFSGVLGLYGYLWNTLKVSVARTLAKDFYLEETATTCRINSDCRTACIGGRELSAGEACICLKEACHYLSGVHLFSQAKFCETDGDCTVSCWEGPVSSKYYERAGGAKNDCVGGCLESMALQSNGEPNTIVCRNRQCEYADGRTCFNATFPNASL